MWILVEWSALGEVNRRRCQGCMNWEWRFGIARNMHYWRLTRGIIDQHQPGTFSSNTLMVLLRGVGGNGAPWMCPKCGVDDPTNLLRWERCVWLWQKTDISSLTLISFCNPGRGLVRCHVGSINNKSQWLSAMTRSKHQQSEVMGHCDDTKEPSTIRFRGSVRCLVGSINN